MGACRTCGGKAGTFKDECKDCESQRVANEQSERAAEARRHAEYAATVKAKAAAELEARTQTFIQESIDSFHRTLAQGRTPYLYSMVSVTVPYSLLEQEGGALPDLHDISALGRDGWEIVATLPQTAGIGLTNVYQRGGGKTWAGGIGGIVTGVLLLVRLPITTTTLSDESEMLRAALRAGYEDKRSFASPQVVIPGIASGKERNGISPLAGVALGAAGMALMVDAAAGLGIVEGDGFGAVEGGGFDDGGGFEV